MDERNDEELDDRVGIPTEPGSPPSVGTGERSHRTTAPPTGRVDPERATWGTSDDVSSSVTDDAVIRNVGGAQGDTPDAPIADFPQTDVRERPGVSEDEGSRR